MLIGRKYNAFSKIKRAFWLIIIDIGDPFSLQKVSTFNNARSWSGIRSALFASRSK